MRSRRSPRSRYLTVAAAVQLAVASLVLLVAPQAHAAPTTTEFAYTGAEQTFTVPSGVTSLHVVAVGGQGGSYLPTVGSGAVTTADISVSPGDVLYVEVGGKGVPEASAGVFNGGAGSAHGGTGGGASDVRTCTLATGMASSCDAVSTDFGTASDPRLVVAGGGGGQGATADDPADAGIGGDAGIPTPGDPGTSDSSGLSGGGGGGTDTSGGAGGTGSDGNGAAGGPGQGGAPGSGFEGMQGGGGGGGFFGGGGGAGGTLTTSTWASGGGGGGSSHVVSGATGVSYAHDSTGVPKVTITYTLPGIAGEFAYTGAEQSYTVPAGVTMLRVVAVGAKGGGFDGGLGVAATADIAVTPGQVLYVEVGGIGSNSGGLDPRSFNGGGAASGAAGGGASDVRTCTLETGLPASCDAVTSSFGTASDPRLVIGAGGGGIGRSGRDGGDGGTPSPGGDGIGFPFDAGGKGATVSAGGAGGSGDSPGDAGGPGVGGDSEMSGNPAAGGGGGGGGFFGGGGGAVTDGGNVDGGGGGGSSHAVATATGVSYATDATGVPKVTINPIVVVTVTGSQPFSSSTPTFSTSTPPPSGHAFTGTLVCTTVDSPAVTISPTLAPGPHTINGSSCSGLSVSEPNGADYEITYTGGTFTVGEKPQISLDDLAVVEGDGGTTVANFTLHRRGDLSVGSSVKYRTGDDTAVAATGDYVAVTTPTLVSFAPGAATALAAVTVTGDTRDETHETFRLLLSSATNALIVDLEATGAITNDDGPGAWLSVDDVAVVEGNSGTTTASFTVSRSGPLDETSSVRASLVARTAASDDFSPFTPVVVTFDPGDTSETVTFSVVGDVADEPNETMSLTFDKAVNATVSDLAGTATIVDDDGGPPVFPSATSLRVDDVTVLEGDSGTTPVKFMITRSGPTDVTTTVRVGTTNGSAVSPSDYTPKARSLHTFAPGDTVKLITVDVNGDTAGEGHETFTLSMSGAQGGVIADPLGIATITNDDGGQAQMGVSNVFVDEGDTGSTPAAFVLTRSGDATEAVQVTVDTNLGATATAGTDFSALAPTVVTLDAGDTEATVPVDVFGDDTPEPAEVFKLRLTKPVRTSVADAVGVATIRDDDSG